MTFPRVNCEIAFPSTPGATNPVRYCVNRWLLEFSPEHGRADEFGSFDAGSMGLVLDNPDRRFEPGFAGSPYFPFVIPDRRVFLTDIWPLNLVRPVDNSGFERSDFGTGRPFGQGWTTSVTGPAVWTNIAASLQGTRAAKLGQPGGGAAGNGTIYSALSPCQGGETFSANCLILGTAVAGGSGTVFGWRAYGDKGATQLIATGYFLDLGVPATVVFPANGGNGFSVDGTSRRYGGYFSVPAAATYVQLFVTPYASTTLARDVRVDAFQLSPGRIVEVYVLGTERDLFNGYAAPNGWPISWNQRTSEVVVDCVDGNALLNRKKVYKYFADTDTGTQINKMLDESQWPTGSQWRSVAAGRAILQPQTIEGEEIGAHIQQCADSELGAAFIDASGKLVFETREMRRARAYSWTFADKPGPTEQLMIAATPNNWPIYNEVKIVPVNAETPFTQGNPDAAVRQADTLVPHTLERQPLVAYGSEAQGQADWLYERYKKDNGTRIESITIDPLRDDALWPVVLSLEIGQKITVKKTAIPGGGADLVFKAIIEKVAHSVVARQARSWLTTLTLSPANTDIYGYLDSTTTGILDKTLVLGF